MTLNEFFLKAPYELKKVGLKKGEKSLLHVLTPTILFILKPGIYLSIEGERENIFTREEMIFLPSGLSCLLSASNAQEVYIFPILHPSVLYLRYISSSFAPLPDLLKEPFFSLPLKEVFLKFLYSLTLYQKDNLLTDKLMEIKTAELFSLFKILYNETELRRFFTPVLSSEHAFMIMVLSSYKKVRTVEEFSEKSGISLSSFNRLFHKVFGVSPYRWMTQKKLESLMEAVTQSSYPLKQVAFDSGFSSLSQMIDFCKKHTGKTPGEIRKKALLRGTMN